MAYILHPLIYSNAQELSYLLYSQRYLTHLLNQVVTPQNSKLQKSFQFIKMRTKLVQVTTDLFLCYQSLIESLRRLYTKEW